MENKKTKLTISGTSKKSIKNIEIAKTQAKNSVFIDKTKNKFVKKGSVYKTSGGNTKSQFSYNRGTSSKSPFTNKIPPVINDFEKRKLAEQRATKRLKGENVQKGKIGSKRRELKLTVSRALSEDDIEFKGRSLASLKRAKQKENKELNKNEKIEDLKPVKRDINIPEVITIRELANRMAEQSSNLIKHLLSMGVTATINHSINFWKGIHEKEVSQ